MPLYYYLVWVSLNFNVVDVVTEKYKISIDNILKLMMCFGLFLKDCNTLKSERVKTIDNFQNKRTRALG